MGYIGSQIPSGYLAGRFGGKIVIASGALIGAILTLLSPSAANINASLFIAVRILIGITQVLFFNYTYKIKLADEKIVYTHTIDELFNWLRQVILFIRSDFDIFTYRRIFYLLFINRSCEIYLMKIP